MANADAPTSRELPPEAYEEIPGDQYRPSESVDQTPHRAARVRLWVFALALLCAGCEGNGPGGPDDRISRDAFVETYVDLRVRALQSPGGDLSDSDRDSLLAEHSVTQEDLIQFVEHYGRDVVGISEVWDSVDSKLRQRREALRAQADSTP